MKKDGQSWQLQEPLAQEDLAQRLPQPYGLEQVASEQATLTLLDDFNWSLWQAGLLLEIEFASVAASRHVPLPESVLCEVTEDPDYKNAALATRGLPDSFFREED